MLPLRLLAIALAVAVGPIGGAAALAAETDPAKAAPSGAKAAATAEIVFFPARGEADACGPGCNEWIAAEGKIDPGAAARLRRVLTKLGHRRVPIYFHSPGGSIAGSLELGRLIRDQKLSVSVGYTVPLACDRDKPLEKSCEAQKHSGRELGSEFDPASTICNSGCVYAVAGGAVRLIPPWVKLGIHDVGFDPDNPPPRALMSEAKRTARTRPSTRRPPPSRSRPENSSSGTSWCALESIAENSARSGGSSPTSPSGRSPKAFLCAPKATKPTMSTAP